MSTTTPQEPIKRGLRLPDLMRRTGLTKSGIYKAIGRGNLPKPRKIGRASVWPEEAIEAIMNPPSPSAEKSSPTTDGSS